MPVIDPSSIVLPKLSLLKVMRFIRMWSLKGAPGSYHHADPAGVAQLCVGGGSFSFRLRLSFHCLL